MGEYVTRNDMNHYSEIVKEQFRINTKMKLEKDYLTVRRIK